MPPTALTAYDKIPYPGAAFQQSHPGRLETLAILFGMTPPDIRHCRVLELGCADGANLIPMACALPDSTFIGIDQSLRQIKPGLETIRSLGLRNVELLQCDIRDVDAGLGAFDYVIAHGVYSWVPTEVQERIFSLCRERLSAQGVAYISYNTYPGWRMRGMLRDMMLYHSRKFDDPQQQVEQARALINWLAESVQAESSPYGLLLKQELEQMRRWKDAYFRHDSLGEINEPVYFHEFVERAERHGLQYLAEADFPSMLASNYSAPVGEKLNQLGRNIIEMEQYMDFLRNRLFRQTLLCHREIKLTRSLGPWSLANLHVVASLRAAKPGLDLDSTESEAFHGGNGLTLSTSQPLVKAALTCLHQQWPVPIAFAELAVKARSLLRDEARTGPIPDTDSDNNGKLLGGVLLTCFTKGLCELHAHPVEFVIAPGERPVACPFARREADQREFVTNRRHEYVTLDKFARHLLPLLNGEHDRNSLAKVLADLVTDGTLAMTVDDQPIRDREEIEGNVSRELEVKLAQFGRNALLIK